MPDITVPIPSIDLVAYFTFKEPFNYYIKNKNNLNSFSLKLRVISIISMKDTIRSDMRDPYTDLYIPAGVSEVAYKKDLIDNVPVLSLSYFDKARVERFIRVPLNYVESISNISNVEYLNRLILIDLNRLPETVDTTMFFTELKDFIETRVGVRPEVTEVSVGNVELVDSEEHNRRETIRNNSATVYQTLELRLREMTHKHDELLARLSAMGIVLG